MRDQILNGLHTGIHTAIQEGERTAGSSLANLSEPDQDLLIEHLLSSVLAALAEVPEGTPVPRATVIEARTPAIMFSPADVVAMLAGAARDADLRDDTIWTTDADHGTDTVPRVALRTYAVPDDYKAFRQFMFKVQAMFGVRIRFVPGSGGPRPVAAVAGTPRGIDAFYTALNAFRAAALDYTTGIDADEQTTFWATLGSLVADNDRARSIAADHEATYIASSLALREAHGPARTLRRATPVTDGPVYERASQVAADAATRGF